MENPEGATGAGSLKMGLSTEAGSSYKKLNIFRLGRTLDCVFLQSAVYDARPAEHIPKSLLGTFANTNCQDIYRRLVDIEPHPLGSISGLALAGGS